jgi:hypothetical protein
MAGDEQSIYQFKALAALERALADPEIREAARRRLSGPVDLGAATAARVEQGTADLGGDDPLAHFQQHWMSGRYFPGVDASTISPTLVAGFRDALDAATADKAVVPVWVRGSDDPESADFRVDHVVTPGAVVVAIITPPPARS